MGRQRRGWVEDVVAHCQGCDWTNLEANALATAARHHDTTGHEVHVRQVICVAYGDPPTLEDLGQTSFDDQGVAP